MNTFLKISKHIQLKLLGQIEGEIEKEKEFLPEVGAGDHVWIVWIFWYIIRTFVFRQLVTEDPKINIIALPTNGVIFSLPVATVLYNTLFFLLLLATLCQIIFVSANL